MADKKSEIKENITAEEKPIDELAQLRSIVFGTAETRLIDKIAILRSDMEKSIESLDQHLSKKISELKQSVEHKFGEIDKRLSFIDKTHDDNEANIQKSLNDLYSEHEMFASATEQDFKEVNQSLDSESNNLSNNFDQQLKQLHIHLEQVSNELSSSKTDRKTLANLLATMASNLENDAQ